MQAKSIANNSGFSTSLWMDFPFPTFLPLQQNLEADVCIIGGGIAGLSCAYTLAKLGKSVVVVDRGIVGGGQTARTTGHLTWMLDDRYYNIESFFGEEGSKLAAKSHFNSIDYIEQIIKDEKIECDFRRLDGYLFVPPNESHDILDKELAAIQKTGLQVSKAIKAPFSKTFDTGSCLHFPNQAEFHVLKYLAGLTQAILKYGGKIYSDTHVTKCDDADICSVITSNNNTITSKAVIVATCTPINDRFYVHTKQAAFRTYVIGAVVTKGTVQKGLYWDTADPYHYIRTQDHSNPEMEWVIIGGEDHRTGQDEAIEEKYIHLESWAKERIPNLGAIEYRWSGQIFEPIDSLAFIGKNPGDKNTYIITGDSGNGLTHATIAGMLIPDLLLGKDNPYTELYNPSRISLKAGAKFLENTLNVSAQYRDWLTPGEQDQIESLSQDSGCIIRKGLKKLAVYKDKECNLHFNNAICPHLGGVVRWNDGEKSWDCPCHGSRFSGSGQVITGPSITGLQSAKSA